MTHRELLKALEILGLHDRATLSEIRGRYRDLVKLHHPDKGQAVEHSPIAAINAAYSIVLSYVNQYRFSFAAEEFYFQNPDEQLRRQFRDPFWGDSEK